MEVSDELRLARRQLETIAGYGLVDDFKWNPSVGQWHLKIKLNLPVVTNDFVQQETFWFILVDDSYPKGNILVMPSKEQGIDRTFQHQNYNGNGNEDYPWRTGKLCLDTTLASWGKKAYDKEPTSAIDRLKWHVLRCIDWIFAASSGALSKENDPFEFPPFPKRTDYLVVFNESEATFHDWNGKTDNHGRFEFCEINSSRKVYVVTSFFKSKDLFLEYDWGLKIKNLPINQVAGIWIKLDSMPIMMPWQIPETFAELFEQTNSPRLKEDLTNEYLNTRRRGQIIGLVMIGFPVSDVIGSQPKSYHWFGFEIIPTKKPPGLFNKSEALFQHEHKALFAPQNKINWVTTENWSKKEISSRGLLLDKIVRSNILVVGAGAVGSLFLELLIRLGCTKIKVVDGDIVKVGNLSRHILNLKDIGNKKAEAVSERINNIFPHVKSSFFNGTIQKAISSGKTEFETFDIIVDATGDDEALSYLSDNLSNSDKSFISISTGINAHRLYCFVCHCPAKSISERFNDNVTPWLKKDKEEFPQAELPSEGIGCWHPLFPSRFDDLTMLLGAVAKPIENSFETMTDSFMVIEKQYDKGTFKGITILQ